MGKASKKLKDQNGLIGVVEIIVIVAVLALVGYGGWRIYQSKKDDTGQKANSSSEVSKTSSWQTGEVVISGNYADADVVSLGDGKYRMYYSIEPEVPGNQLEMYSATSEDGIKWAPEAGTRKTMATFPSVIRLADGSWRLYFQNAGVIKSAISSDGLVWTDESGTRVDATNPAGLTLTNVGAPTVAKIGDSYVMVYFGAINEPYTAEGKVPSQETHPLLWATSVDGLSFEKRGIALDSRNSVFKGWMDGPELVAWDGGESRLYFWGYTGVYYSVFAGGDFSEPTLTLAAPNPDNKLFPANPPGDPTLIKINGTWSMYYGQHQKGIYRSVLE